MKDGHFEAKKHAYRQTQDGVVISFVVHPSDISEAMAMAALGTRFMVAFAEIGDDEKPKGGDANTRGNDPLKTPPQDEHVATPGARLRRPFKELSLPEQAGMRCQDLLFREFITTRDLGWKFEDAADFVRQYCGVKSRAELSTDRDAANRWRALESDYQSWVATHQYANSIR